MRNREHKISAYFLITLIFWTIPQVALKYANFEHTKNT